MAYNRELSQLASLVDVGNTSKRIGFSTDINVSGVITATKFYGSGRFLTDIIASTIPSTNADLNQILFNTNGIIGGTADLYYNADTKNVGIGTSVPSSKLQINTSDGTVKVGVITAQATTDNGIVFAGIGTISSGIGSTTATSGLFTEVNGLILSNAVNVSQVINPRDATRVGGIFRFDTRSFGDPSAGSSVGDYSCFVVKYTPVGIATSTPAGEKNGIVISLQDGQTYLVPDGGNVLVGLKTDTRTPNQKLQVSGGAYVSNNLGVGITNPATSTQVAIAGTLGISEVGGIGTRTLLSSSQFGFTLDHTDNSDISFQSQSSTKLQYNVSSDSWILPQTTGTKLLIGSGTTTGTSSQTLQVTGGAYVSDNLGVGNTNPGTKLDVAGDIRLSASDPEIEFNIGGPRLKVPAANTLTIHSGGGLNTTSNELIRLNNTGVGIGTTNPTQKLQVEGNLLVSGISTFNKEIYLKKQSVRSIITASSIVFGL